jgi:hypothetical protein
MTVSPLLAILRARSGWDAAMTELRKFWEERHPGVETGVAHYSAVYSGRRAAMVFDVVASRQRDYLNRVRRLVADFEQTPAAAGLAALASNGPGPGLSLMSTEAITVKQVAAGLHRYCEERQLDDDHGVAQWAVSTEPLRFAPRLDSYVGSVTGVGVALFAYLRMRRELTRSNLTFAFVGTSTEWDSTFRQVRTPSCSSPKVPQRNLA